jgi:hypothetical protein
VLAGLERRLDRGLGRIALAADQLDEDVDVGIGASATGSSNQRIAAEVDAAILARGRARTAVTTSIGRPQRDGESCLPFRDQPDDEADPRAETGDTDGRADEADPSSTSGMPPAPDK